MSLFEQLLRIYKGHIRPHLEYCSHVLGSALKAVCLINAPNLISQLPSLKFCCDVTSFFIFYKYYFGLCLEGLSYCVPSPENWGAILCSPLLHMNFVLKLATLISIDIVLSSFLTQEICGTLCLLHFFLPPTICLPLNVGCSSTLEALIEFFSFIGF